jgi:hypothetical protein
LLLRPLPIQRQVQDFAHMRRTLLAAAVIAAGIAASSSSALAFGDTCYRDVTARGDVRSSMRGAMDAAIAAWERTVARQRGSRFANWWYSGDRVTSCSWDVSGTRIRCTATAMPCASR